MEMLRTHNTNVNAPAAIEPGVRAVARGRIASHGAGFTDGPLAASLMR